MCEVDLNRFCPGSVPAVPVGTNWSHSCTSQKNVESLLLNKRMKEGKKRRVGSILPADVCVLNLCPVNLTGASKRRGQRSAGEAFIGDGGVGGRSRRSFLGIVDRWTGGRRRAVHSSPDRLPGPRPVLLPGQRSVAKGDPSSSGWRVLHLWWVSEQFSASPLPGSAANHRCRS